MVYDHCLHFGQYDQYKHVRCHLRDASPTAAAAAAGAGAGGAGAAAGLG